MSGRKELLAPGNSGVVSLDDHIRSTEHFKPTGDRVFEYNLSEKANKTKLLKGAKRPAFLLEENSTSSNLVFSVGSWNYVVLPSVRSWNVIKDDQKCQIGDYIIKIGGIQSGKESNGKYVDTKIVFFADRDKVTCHF